MCTTQKVKLNFLKQLILILVIAKYIVIKDGLL